MDLLLKHRRHTRLYITPLLLLPQLMTHKIVYYASFVVTAADDDKYS